MAIHTGHPEKYLEIEDRIGELIYDHHLDDLSLDEIEAIKQQQQWVPLTQQQLFACYEQ